MLEYELVQPSARREWHLCHGRERVATLRVPVFRAGASATIGDAEWRIEQRRALRGDYTLRERATGEELARLRADGHLRWLELSGRTAECQRLRGGVWAAIDSNGTALVRVRLRARFLRMGGNVQLSADLDERDAIAATLLAAYVGIREGDHGAAATALTGSLSA